MLKIFLYIDIDLRKDLKSKIIAQINFIPDEINLTTQF